MRNEVPHSQYFPKELWDEFAGAIRKKALELNKDISKKEALLMAIEEFIFEAKYGFLVNDTGEENQKLINQFIKETLDNNERKKILLASMEMWNKKKKIAG